jgi:phospholipid/cholesterol/gamma-HCH transport system substrate-binding protein
MAYERAEILAGAAILAVAAGFAIYAAGGSGVVGDAESYPLTASFRSVEGISVGSDVRLAGVKVGTVTGLRLNPETYFADATISMRKDVALPTDSTILISGWQFRRGAAGGRLGNAGAGRRDRGHAGRGQPDHPFDEICRWQWRKGDV